MSEYNDIAGSDDIISLNYESQETFNEHSYRTKQSANRVEKNLSNQAKENQKPDEVDHDTVQDDTQNYTFPIVNNGVSIETVVLTNDAQITTISDNAFIIPLPLVQSTLTDESSISIDKDSLPVNLPIQEEITTVIEIIAPLKVDSNVSGVDITTTTADIRLYVSPSTSLLETTHTDDAQPNPDNISTEDVVDNNKEIEINDKPKEEPMDTSDAQVSLGSDGIIESHPTSALIIESTSATEKSTTVQSPSQSRISVSPNSKALYALSQPTTDKFEKILAKITTSPSRKTSSIVENKVDSTITIREEEELFIKESVSKIVRRYAVKTDQHGRMLSRDLLIERVVEEQTTTRIESWPPVEKKSRQSVTRPVQSAEPTRKKQVKSPVASKRRAKSLKPTSVVVVSPKTSKAIQSDNDETPKTNTNKESSDDDDNDNEDDKPTDNLEGDEFIPPPINSTGESLAKGLRIFAKWVDGKYYPGIIGGLNKADRYLIEFDDGAKRYVKSNEIISQSFLVTNQDVMAQTLDGRFHQGIVKHIIKKKKTGNLGYIIEKDGKEKWYPLRFVSLTSQQAENLQTISKPTDESTAVVQGKRKRVSNVPQTPNKKTKSSIFISPSKTQRSTFTPTRQTKLFNTMYFLFTGFNDLMDVRHEITESIESHGGKVLEKMPNMSRRENVYLISDVARKTAKFLEAKKSNVPCVSYKWISESIEKSEVQDWEPYKLVLLEKEVKKTTKKINDDEDEEED